MKWLNQYGLKNGRIPKGSICPWHTKCTIVNERCPKPGNTKDNNYSCATARAFSIVGIKPEV